MAKSIQDARELSLQILRQNGVSDWPANDRKVIRPRTRRLRTVELAMEALKFTSNPISDAVAVSNPPRGFFFECLPVLVASVAVPEFRCVHNPGETMVS